MEQIPIPGMIAVGMQILPPTQQNGATLELTGAGAILMVLMNRPKPAERKEFAAEQRFGVATYKSAMFFLFKLGALPWASCPFSSCLYACEEHAEEARGLVDTANGTTDRLLVTPILVDSSTGVVTDVGAVTLPPLVTRALLDVSRAQWARRTSFSKARFDADVQMAYRLFPTDEAMVASALAFGEGGK